MASFKRQWDWSDAVQKSARISAARRRTNARPGFRDSKLSAAEIHAMVVFQNRCCAITSVELYLPAVLRPGTTFKYLKLSSNQRQRLPVLERLDYTKGFESGNVVIIAAMLASVYSWFKGMSGFLRAVAGSKPRVLGPDDYHRLHDTMYADTSIYLQTKANKTRLFRPKEIK
jgi:hypothetical protein